MQVSATTPSAPAPPATGGVVAEVMRQAAILADDSGASEDQKIDAYIAISTAIVTSAAGRAGWFQQSTQADRDALNATWNNSAVSKQIRKAADDFNARGMSAPREGNVMADQIAHLNKMSATQQKMIFAGTSSLDQTPTIEGWKAFLQENADGRDQQLAAEKAEKASKEQAVQVSLSDDAKAALEALTDENRVGGVAEAALGMLRKAAEERAEAKAEKDRAKEPGAIVDETA
ncbi:hypothetical protein [Caulobacter sp.]|uniref:hypothetical protein n=1 Tax=Caulobacter sp. TaxID=78 RepID=UPI001B2782D3|nr:hypothetical protein [Caulobacter sp.]MBO9543096.1 hypothetical protein [Caulobacter sp.]